jgi:hypothetical protein
MVRVWWRSLWATYFTIDPRSLGLFRIVFSLVLLSDLARRWVEIGFWYTNQGLLPNHTLLWRPPAGRMFSLFFGVSQLDEAGVGFALCGAIYVALLFGYRTRWVQVLALVARVSLNTRLAVLENGGDMVMDLLCLLTLPLPLGARFSLDAVGRAMLEPAKSTTERDDSRPFASLAVLGLLLQFSIIYLFNAAAKDGPGWRDGTAVYYALHQDKLVTAFGVWMREHLPLSVIAGLTRATLATEWLGFALIISPLFVHQARLLAVCIMPVLHLGFALGLNLGGFSPAMMSFYPLLLTARHWNWLSSRYDVTRLPLRARLLALSQQLLAGLRFRPQEPASKTGRVLMECGVAVLLLAITTEVLNDNTPVPDALRVPQPRWAKALIEYPRILQGWRMFANEPSRGDTMIHVSATTAAGARVDPYNEVASNQHFPDGKVVPTHMGQSQFFVMYSERIPNAGYAAYRQAFSEWLLAYPQRTGRPQDCLLSYEVYFVSDRTPPPGTGGSPEPAERISFMTYRAPSDGDCRPARPAEASAPVAAH